MKIKRHTHIEYLLFTKTQKGYTKYEINIRNATNYSTATYKIFFYKNFGRQIYENIRIFRRCTQAGDSAADNDLKN